jgi:hypothetical protein
MSKRSVWLFGLALVGVGLARAAVGTDSSATLETAKYVERDYRLENGRFVPSWITCDGERDVAIISRGAKNTVRIQRFAKSAPATVETATYALGEGDSGMSQTYYSLGGSTKQFLRLTQAAVYDDARRQPASLHLNNLDTKCGRVIGVRFLGVTLRRSVYVWQEQNGLLHYESFDYRFARAEQPPSTVISGGTLLKTAGGRITYSFQKNAITYRVVTSSQPSSASISVLKGNALLQTEIPIGYADVRDK